MSYRSNSARYTRHLFPEAESQYLREKFRKALHSSVLPSIYPPSISSLYKSIYNNTEYNKEYTKSINFPSNELSTFLTLPHSAKNSFIRNTTTIKPTPRVRKFSLQKVKIIQEMPVKKAKNIQNSTLNIHDLSRLYKAKCQVNFL